MIYTASLTKKGQVTIPVEIRRWLKLKPYEKVAFEEQDDQVVVKKVRSIKQLKGSLRSNIHLTDKQLNEARKAFEKNWADYV